MLDRFCRSCVLLTALAVVISLAPPATHAQNPRERTLFVSVVDKNGEPVSDLSAKAFIVREDRVHREILRVLPADEPMDIAVLIDNSTALGNDLTFFRDGLSRFVNAMVSSNQNRNHVALIGLA